MITADQAIHWLWQQYMEAPTVPMINYWFDRFAENRMQQRASEGVV